jgi:hypothetical protein
MASPDISLAPSSVSPQQSSGTQNGDLEKRPQEANPGFPEEGHLAAEAREIEYLYLDFESELPSPAGLSALKSESTPPPPCPDLKQYTSPFLWSNSRKIMITWLACAVTVLAAYSAGEYAPAAEQLRPVWNVSTVAFDTGITCFTTGFAIAPMVLAPFSEINGRRPVFIASGILFTGTTGLELKEADRETDEGL